MNSIPYELSSEAVSDGHPDKIADFLSDAVLDQVLLKDPKAKVACEVFLSEKGLVIGGEISSRASYQISRAIERVDDFVDCSSVSLQSLPLINYIREQSVEIAHGVEQGGAGDQGIFFGFACQETKAYLPFPLYYSYQLVEHYKKLRQKPSSLFKADAKAQLVVQYENEQAKRISKVVFSAHHDAKMDLQELRYELQKDLIEPILEPTGLLYKPQLLINPAGSFSIGGLKSDTGVTGRKIIVDTYGGFAPHGGGAFSGKDPSKADRFAPYIARYLAKKHRSLWSIISMHSLSFLCHWKKKTPPSTHRRTRNYKCRFCGLQS